MSKFGFVFYIIVTVNVKLAVCDWVLLLISLYTLVKIQQSLARTYDTSSSAESFIPISDLEHIHHNRRRTVVAKVHPPNFV